jgi:hypothetical protein
VKADKAITVNNYEMAVELYSAAIGLDSSSYLLFANRSKAKLGRNLYVEALHDADKVCTISFICSSNRANDAYA